MDTQLDIQAWLLYYKLSQLAYSYGLYHSIDITIEKKRKKLLRVSERAFQRWLRRENQYLNNPDGFAPLSRQSSGVVGEGAL